MTDVETVAEALGVGEAALAAFVDDDTTAADVLGRFPDADAEYAEARALVEAWLGGGDPPASGTSTPAPEGARGDCEGGDAEPPGESHPGPDTPTDAEAHDERERVTDSNSNGGDDDRRDTSGGGCKGSETPDGTGTADAGDGAGTGTPDDSAGYRPTCGTDDGGDDLPSWRELYDAARRRAGREPWEYVEAEHLRAVLAEHGLAAHLENGALHGTGGWRHVDMSDDDEPADSRWYYPSGDEPRPDEFRRFDRLLRARAPDDYTPHYFRVARAGKDPATQFGGWKQDDARLTVEEAVAWMEKGGNVGIAGRGGCRGCGGRASGWCPECEGDGNDDALVNVDIDDDEETTPDDVPTSLRARSRSRTGWHTWYFDDGDDPIPNIPTDDYGEVRTEWQYVVAPGSFVASAAEELPDDADHPGYYTVEDPEPVARIEYDDLPDVFVTHAEATEEATAAREEEADEDTATGANTDLDLDEDDLPDDRRSGVFDIDASDLVTTRNGADRFASIFHGSDTGANMSVGDGTLTCWRHLVTHGGLQALAVLSDKTKHGCKALGKPHTNGKGNRTSSAGPNRLKGDWELVWAAWHYAKNDGLLDDDDPLPYRVLLGLALEGGVAENREAFVERDQDSGRVVDDPDEHDGETYTALPPGTYNDALEYAAEEADVPLGREPVKTADDDGEPVETCAPPAVDRVDVDDITDRWRAIRDRLDDLGDTPTIFADQAGAGKTTNAGIGLAEAETPHAMLFDKHEKAREYIQDDATPGDYYHLRGGPQPKAGGCLDAHHAGEPCDEHGHTSNCPRMCPVYDLDPDAPLRVAYERLLEEVGPVRAHRLLADELPGHDGDGSCRWLAQFDDLRTAERVVGVHEYQTLKTIQNPADGPSRQVAIDETPSVDGRDRLLDVEDLIRLANAIEPPHSIASADDDPTEHNHRHARAELAAFARRVVDALTDEGAPDTLADVEPPAFASETITMQVDPDDLPAHISPADVRVETITRDAGMPGEGYETIRQHVVEVDLLAETLAQAKRAYESAILGRIRSDEREWNRAPLATNALLAAAAAAGADEQACRQAIAAPPELRRCPRCGDDLEAHDGRLLCGGCGWDEAEDYLVGPHGRAARCTAELRDTPDATGLHRRRLPHPHDLPDDPLILDATATPEKVAALYGVDREAVQVYGADTLTVDQLNTTQILDGQYHASTIRDTASVRERVERTAEKLADAHGSLLIVGKSAVLDAVDLPTDRGGVDQLHYHAARGLNRAQYDAVVVIGAPHPDVADLQRDAALLAQDRDGSRVGGVEHSTRRDSPNPPVYRKLDYTDDDGRGRAVATKHYTGLTGALFREAREKELEQVVHRIRPLLADDSQHAYLLTNVPTDLRVDEVCAFDELADPLETLLPVPEGALDLLEAVRDAAAGDLDVDGVRAERLVETVGGERSDEGDVRFRIAPLHQLATVAGLDVSKKTVRRWVDGLTDLGLLDAGEYEYRAGVPYAADPSTLTSALSVVSNNASVKVAARRRFARLVAAADGTLSWLDRARAVLGLRGGGEPVNPPPDSPRRPADPAD